MNELNTKTGLLEIRNGNGETGCDDKLCNKTILDGDLIFYDLIKIPNKYCFSCGPCIRYSRKKALERGEQI